EINILTNEQTNESKSNLDAIQPVVSAGDILMMQEQSKQIKVDESLLSYIAQLVQATRNDPSLMLGASPRASIAILNASKARAILHGRDLVVPDDIKTVALPVLGHRMILTPEREMEGAKPQDIITSIIDTIKVPR
ncbi:MAG: MoxR family ATPase, partial [Saprospiraceae bacterium]|nr:MoxR family ATPase [Saprospiraceae bacterium]